MKQVTELRERRTMTVMMLKVAREKETLVSVYWMSDCSRRGHSQEHVPQNQKRKKKMMEKVHLLSKVPAVNGERVQVR